MPRKKKLVEKEVLSVEVVVWHDAAGRNRKIPTIDPLVFRTVGMVLAETDSELVMAYDIVAVDDYLDDEHKEEAVTTNIPLMNVIERVKLGEVNAAMDKEAWREYVKRIEAFRAPTVLRTDGPGTDPAQPEKP